MDKLINKLLDRIREETEGLASNPAPTLHDYHRRVGLIHGLQAAVQALFDARREAERDDS